MRAFNVEKLRPNLRFPSWPWHLLATASSSALRQGPTHLSLHWSEEKSFRGRSFYKHLTPNGAKSHKTLLHFKVESTNGKWSLRIGPDYSPLVDSTLKCNRV